MEAQYTSEIYIYTLSIQFDEFSQNQSNQHAEQEQNFTSLPEALL